MNRSVVLTTRGIGFLVAAAVCFVAAPIFSLPALLYVTVLLVGLVLFSTIFVFGGHSNVRIERSFSPQVVGPGLTAKATVRVTNLSMIPCLEAQWEDSSHPASPATRPAFSRRWAAAVRPTHVSPSRTDCRACVAAATRSDR